MWASVFEMKVTFLEMSTDRSFRYSKYEFQLNILCHYLPRISVLSSVCSVFCGHMLLFFPTPLVCLHYLYCFLLCLVSVHLAPYVPVNSWIYLYPCVCLFLCQIAVYIGFFSPVGRLTPVPVFRLTPCSWFAPASRLSLPLLTRVDSCLCLNPPVWTVCHYWRFVNNACLWTDCQ